MSTGIALQWYGGISLRHIHQLRGCNQHSRAAYQHWDAALSEVATNAVRLYAAQQDNNYGKREIDWKWYAGGSCKRESRQHPSWYYEGDPSRMMAFRKSFTRKWQHGVVSVNLQRFPRHDQCRGFSRGVQSCLSSGRNHRSAVITSTA